MAWLKVDDTTHSHPTVEALALGGDERQLNEALGWLTRCAAYSADHELDGWIPEPTAERFAGADRYPILLRVARNAKILLRSRTRGGPTNQPGIALDSAPDDRVFHVMTKEELEVNRGRRGSTRLQDDRMRVRLRDGDQCRYCAKTVDFGQRKTNRSGRYEHPNPDDRDTFVIACRECDLAKGKRTPAEWHAAGGHLLKPPPAKPVYNPKTSEWLTAAGLLTPRPEGRTLPEDSAQRATAPAASAAPARTSSQLEDAATPEPDSSGEPLDDAPEPDPDPVQIRSRSDPGSSPSALPRQGAPGRDGSGRVGSSSGPPTSLARDGPTSPAGTRSRPRGARGRRGRGRPT